MGKMKFATILAVAAIVSAEEAEEAEVDKTTKTPAEQYKDTGYTQLVSFFDNGLTKCTVDTDDDTKKTCAVSQGKARSCAELVVTRTAAEGVEAAEKKWADVCVFTADC